MDNAITANAETNTLTANCSNGNCLEYSPKTDRRIVEVIDGKVFCRSEKAAYEIEREMRAMGLGEARSLGCAVVFWS